LRWRGIKWTKKIKIVATKKQKTLSPREVTKHYIIKIMHASNKRKIEQNNHAIPKMWRPREAVKSYIIEIKRMSNEKEKLNKKPVKIKMWKPQETIKELYHRNHARKQWNLLSKTTTLTKMWRQPRQTRRTTKTSRPQEAIKSCITKITRASNKIKPQQKHQQPKRKAIRSQQKVDQKKSYKTISPKLPHGIFSNTPQT
jgi:hypothetical protein